MFAPLKNLRSAITTNATFTHLMAHVGACDNNDGKIAADAFETCIAAYYLENGFVSLCSWVAIFFKPLFHAAQKAYVYLQVTFHGNSSVY